MAGFVVRGTRQTIEKPSATLLRLGARGWRWAKGVVGAALHSVSDRPTPFQAQLIRIFITHHTWLQFNFALLFLLHHSIFRDPCLGAFNISGARFSYPNPSNHGPELGPFRLKLLNSGDLLQRQPNVIQAVQETVAGEFFHGEGDRVQTRAPDFQLLQIYLHLFSLPRYLSNSLTLLHRQGEREHGIFQRVISEDFAETLAQSRILCQSRS